MAWNPRELATDRYRPILHWKWNADPTPRLMREQLRRIVDAGFGGICIQPMPDNFRPRDFPRRMKMAYLGTAFFDAYCRAVELAVASGLIVWIYDEGGWPSGQACGQVLEDHPHFQGQVLIQEAGRLIKAPSGRVDPLNRQATDRFIDLTHERYSAALGTYFGRGIEAFFSDELSVPGMVGTDRIPWTDDLPEQFAARTGDDLDRVLPWLFEGSAAQAAPREQVVQARHAFTRVWNELFIERCLKPQHAWCRDHGVLLTGHLAGDHEISRHPVCFGDYFHAMQYFDGPGIDTIWRQIWPDHRADFALYAGSARIVFQRDWAMSETGAVYGLDIIPAQLKWVGDQQIMRGINRLTLMSMPLADEVNEGLKPYGAANPMWEALADWNRHAALLAAFTSAGRPGVRRAVLYPTDDLWACGSDGPGTLVEVVAANLLRRSSGCIYVDGQTLMEGKLEEGAVWCGDARIEQVYVAGGSWLTPASFTSLQRIAQAGVRVIAVGEQPLKLIDSRSGGPPRDFTVDQLPVASLPEVDTRFPLAADFELAASSDDLIVQHRIGTDWQLLLLSNEAQHPIHIEYRLPVPGLTWKIDSDISHVAQCDGTGRFDIDASGIVAIAWGEVINTPSDTDPPREHADAGVYTIGDSWTLQADWRMAIDGDQWKRQAVQDTQAATRLGPWSGLLGEAFSGQASYTTTIALDDGADPQCWRFLDLGDVKYVAEVWLNGHRLGRRAWAPYRFELGDYLRGGVNHLRVAVRNTPANAFWDPSHVAGLKAAGKWNIYGQRILERCPPVLDGGLYGPVALVSFEDALSCARHEPVAKPL